MEQETVNELSTSQTMGEGETSAAPAAKPALTGKRANWTIAHKIDGQLVRFSVKDAGELVLDVAKVNAANRARAEMHGFVQRISDAAAMARDSKTGASATPQQKYEAMKRLVEHYVSGAEDWSPARDTAGVGRPRSNPSAELLKIALRIFNPEKSEETIAQFVKERNAAQVTALLLSEQLKDAVELAREQQRQSEAKLAEGVNAEELLSGL